MKYVLGRADWRTLAQGEEHCFLLTNGLGGYCSQTVIGSNARGDHSLLMAAVTAPSERWSMVKRMDEVLYVDGHRYDLASQACVTETQNREGYRFLDVFCYDGLPRWEYTAEGVRVEKRLVMPYGANSLAVHYEITADPGQRAWLEVTPAYGFHPKNALSCEPVAVTCSRRESTWCLAAQGQQLYLETNGRLEEEELHFVRWYRYFQDSSDGRDGWGGAGSLHRIISDEAAGACSVRLSVIYAMDRSWLENIMAAYEHQVSAAVSGLLREELLRQKGVADRSGLRGAAARQLAVSAYAYLTRRDSTRGMSIIAGFPFFGDWGRDTMIAFYGCTLATGEQETARNILRTFMRYCRRGIMPNLFPEGNEPPLYNTVDASLLFINALWEYLQKYPDQDFAAEALPVAESIVCWYACGTDYNIHMDEDALLAAGSGLWQLTWMDVRYNDILPTPRHGKPVEINAYWYNAVSILRQLYLNMAQGSSVKVPEAQEGCLSEEKRPELTAGWEGMDMLQRADYLDALAEQIKASFLEKFSKPDGTLYDVLADGQPEAMKQIRCNEIFALTLPFTMIGRGQAAKILAQVRRELYTPVGLRSLSLYDREFHPAYGGPQSERDMAYHQGTVWTYPLGAYYRACLRFAENKKEEAMRVARQLEAIEAAMAEGCLGQLPEIYDGEQPGTSRGCFAQAWSVAELLRVYEEAEQYV